MEALSSPATFLVFLAAPARAGIVPSYLPVLMHRLPRLIPCSAVIYKLLLPGRLFDLCLSLMLDLDPEKPHQYFVAYTGRHIGEQLKGLFLIFHKRVFLSIPPQPDTLFEVVDTKEVVFPLGVDHLEENHL